MSLDEAPLLVVKVSGGDEEDSWDSRRSSSTTSTSSSPSSHASSFVTHALPRAALSAPALWPAIAATVVAPAGKEPEALLLVHKIEEDGEEAEEGSPPPHSSHHHLRLSDFAALERGGLATAELAGRVGDCCHGEKGEGEEAERERSKSGSESGFVDGDLRALISPRSSPSVQHSETHWGSSSSSSSAASDVAFYGVVVQTAKAQQQRAPAFSHHDPAASDVSSSSLAAASGCFVLKTVRTRPSAPGGCSCVYYSLTRVGRAGEPLAEQLKRSWLA